jgi:hypothetical protein
MTHHMSFISQAAPNGLFRPGRSKRATRLAVSGGPLLALLCITLIFLIPISVQFRFLLRCSSIKDFKGCVSVHVQKEQESQGAEYMGIGGIRKRFLYTVTGAAADLANALTVYHPILRTYINCSLTHICVGSVLQVSWEQLCARLMLF